MTFREGDKTSKTIDVREVVPKPRPPIPADRNDLAEMEYWKYEVVDSEELLASNLTTAYGLFCGQCTNQLKAKLEARSEFEQFKANADVIRLDEFMHAEICRTKDKSKSTAVSFYLSHKAWLDLTQGVSSNDEYFHHFNTYYNVIH